MQSTRISQLAQTVQNCTTRLDIYLNEKGLPTPSFDANGPTDFGITSDDIQRARVHAIEAAVELIDLLQGPITFLRPMNIAVSLMAISRWNVANKVPLDGEIAFAELAEKCGGVHEADMRRILRYAMVHHRLFCEPRAGFVAHSLASRLLAEEPLLADSFWLLADELQKTAPYTIEAMEKYQDQEPGHSAFSLAHGTEKSMYEVLEEDPALSARFARAMTAFAKFTSRPSTVHRKNFAVMYPWEKLEGRIVDVGGSRGTDAFALAKAFPHLHFTVQDLPRMIVGAEASIPPELAGRVEFMPYDFFTPQTLEADAYILKQCFHNWPDHYCVRIVKNQIPALRPGARLIIVDSLIPEPGTMGIMAERQVRSFDLMMMANSNGREREPADWLKLFEQADPRFKVVSMQPISRSDDFGPATGIIEVVWEVEP